MRKQLTIAILSTFILSLTALAQQDKSKRPSPPASTQCKFSDGQTINVDYSSPRMKGRKIFGGLVPYGQVWRTGANEATTFVTTADLKVKGKKIPVGSYTIFTVPEKKKWTLIINKHTGEWGIPYHYESEELARVPMKATATATPVEDFTIGLTQSRHACTLQVGWENTQASVSFAEKK